MIYDVNIVCALSMLCNLRCSYCDVLPRVGDPRRMSIENVRRMFSNVEGYYRNSPKGTRINFQWYGGEPLLTPPAEFRRIFAIQRQIFADSGHRVTNSVQSNFTVLDDQRIALLKEEFDAVGASLDHFGDLRVNRSGVCQEDLARANLERVLAADVKVSGITVLSRPNLGRVGEIYAFYKERAMRFRILPLERGLYQAGQTFEVTPREVLSALCTLADIWLADDAPVRIEPLGRYLSLVRRSLFSIPVKKYQRDEWPVILLVDTDGSIHGYGDRFGGSLGNIFSTDLEAAFSSPAYRASCGDISERMQRTCSRCPYFGKPCPGDGIAEGHQDFTEVDEAGDPICIVPRGLISHLEHRVQDRPGWVFSGLGDAMVGVDGSSERMT